MRKNHSLLQFELSPQQKLLMKLKQHASKDVPEDPRIAALENYRKEVSKEQEKQKEQAANSKKKEEVYKNIPKKAEIWSRKLIRGSTIKLYNTQSFGGNSGDSRAPNVSMANFKKILHGQEYNSLDLEVHNENQFTQTPKPNYSRRLSKQKTANFGSFGLTSKHLQSYTTKNVARPINIQDFGSATNQALKLMASTSIENENGKVIPVELHRENGIKEGDQLGRVETAPSGLGPQSRANSKGPLKLKLNLTLSSAKKTPKPFETKSLRNAKSNVFRFKSLKNNDYIFGILESQTQEYFLSKNKLDSPEKPMGSEARMVKTEESPLKRGPSSPKIKIRSNQKKKTQFGGVYSPGIRSPLLFKGSGSQNKRAIENGSGRNIDSFEDENDINKTHEEKIEEAKSEILKWKSQLDNYSKKFGVALQQLQIMKEKDVGRQATTANTQSKTSLMELKARFSFTIRLIIFKLKMMGLTYKEIVLNKVFASVPYEKPDSEKFFKAVRAGDFEQVCYIVKFDRYIIFDYDVVIHAIIWD